MNGLLRIKTVYLSIIWVWILFSAGSSSALPDKQSKLNKALLAACAQGRLWDAKQLIEKGADANSVGVFGSRPLHFASSTVRDHPELLRLLIENGAKVNIPNTEGMTPLHLAADYNRVDSVITLLNNGADPSIKDQDGKIALDYAKLRRFPKIIQILSNTEHLRFKKKSIPSHFKRQPPKKPVPPGALPKLSGICYSSSGVTFPALDKKSAPLESFREKIELIFTMSHRVKASGAPETLKVLSKLCGQSPLQFFPEAKIGGDAAENKQQIDALIHIGKERLNSTRGLIVGKRVVSDEKIDLMHLVEYIKRVKNETGLPVSTSEILDRWMKHPELATAVDFILVNVHPYLEGIDIRQAASNSVKQLEMLNSYFSGKKTVMGETGWPESGPKVGLAVPGVENQARYLKEFSHLADKKGIPYFYYTAFDENWDHLGGMKKDRAWGICDLHGNVKTKMVKFFPEAVSFISNRPNKEGRDYIVNSIDMIFAYIPPGTFHMSPFVSCAEKGTTKKTYPVTLASGFYMQTTEVTQAQWLKVMKKKPEYYKKIGGDYPVVNVTWHDCQAFIRRLNQLENTDKYYLPTEAQWEYACRAGKKALTFWGENDQQVCEFANIADLSAKNSKIVLYPFPCNDGYVYSAPVANFKPNDFGLYDMIGNVWEWCRDRYENQYSLDALTDPESSQDSTFRVIKGGGWNSIHAQSNAGYRGRGRPQKTGKGLGFRIVREDSEF